MAARGFTLVELMVSCAVLAVLLGLAVPAFRDLHRDWTSSAAINGIVAALSYARTLAITRSATVTVCPGRNGTCLGRDQWHNGTLIFVDGNGNGRLDAGETVDRALPGLDGGARLYWRSFRNRGYLQFTASGYTPWQNGSFLYCPADGSARFARMVIINAPGRTRPARDRDRDGVAEDASGQPLTCS